MNAPATPVHPPISWDESNVHHLTFPNFCNVESSDRDVTLVLGNGRADPALPVAAKLLCNLLHRTVAAFESEHGPISNGAQPVPGSAPLPEARPPLLVREELSERGALLGELIQGLGAPMDIERSLKFLPGAILHERYLLSIDTANLPAAAQARLPVICKRLRMPEPLLAAFEKGWPGAHSLHFGFEAQGSACVYKAYLEPGGEARDAVQEGRPGPVELYTGFKWDPESPDKHATSRYVAHPALSSSAMRERTAPFLGESDLQHVISDLIGLAAARTDARQFLHVEVTEDGNPRSSFDLNLYPAGLELSELCPLLLKTALHFGIPLDTFRGHYERFRRETFGHVSGGTDRSGRGFLTFYFGGRRPTP
jgi:hypothetical protein